MLAVASCSGDGSGTPFHENAALQVLRPGWPGLTDAQILAEKMPPFRKACTEKFDTTSQASMTLTLNSGGVAAAAIRAGCPERVASLND